jgi:hypothetical protein
MARYEIDFLVEHTEEALLAEIRRVASQFSGSYLTGHAFEQLSGRISLSAIRHRFGGWKKALEKAGLSQLYSGQPVSDRMRSQLARQLSDDDLIADMRRVHDLMGRGYLTIADLNRHSVAAEGTIRRRFGSWDNALQKAGLAKSSMGRKGLTDQQCFENLATVWTALGRRPVYAEMSRPPSQIGKGTYEKRWGTWRKALAAFIEWANADKDIDSDADQPGGLQPSGEAAAVAPKLSSEDRREVGPRLRFKVFQRDRFRCVACGRSPATHLHVELHADHIRSVADGGKTIFENLQALCHDCNLGKGRVSIS